MKEKDINSWRQTPKFDDYSSEDKFLRVCPKCFKALHGPKEFTEATVYDADDRAEMIHETDTFDGEGVYVATRQFDVVIRRCIFSHKNCGGQMFDGGEVLKYTARNRRPHRNQGLRLVKEPQE